MSARTAFSFLQRLLAWAVLLCSGAYLLIYLYRWEWNRAIVSGIFFVAAEVALATSLVLRRLRAVERGGAAAPSTAASPLVLARLRATPVDRPHPFRWLRPDDPRLGVFVPVLLGAGVVLSALAYLVERVAEATAVPLLDRGLARRLDALALPDRVPPVGGGPTRPTPHAGAARGRPGSLLALVVGVASLAVVATFAILTLSEATQTRPEAGPRPERTVLRLELDERRTDRGPLVAAEALWVACRATVERSGTVEARIVATGQHDVAVIVEPGLSRLVTRRVSGCLSDLTLDLVRADVVAVEHTAG